MRRLLVLLFSAAGFVSCSHEDLWEQIKEDAEADWKAIKESLSDGMESMEKEVKEDWEKVKDTAKEDWEMVKDAAKEDWEVVKEEGQDDWNKLDLAWNKLAPSDSKVLPAESAESEEAESKEERRYTQDYVDLWESNLIKESDKNAIVTEDATLIKCSNLCFVSQSSDRQEEECKKGCSSQKREFKDMQEKFQKTEASLLLGSALDRCWEGCQSKPQCIDGCNVMRTLQISQMKREKEQKALQDMVAKDVEVEKKEEEFKEEATDKEQELRKASNEKESDFFVETSVGEDESIEQPHVWTYVLWRPSFSADGLPSLSQADAQESYAQMVELIKSMMGGWDMSGNELESRRGGWLGEEATGRGGWRDDRMQLKLPEETAAALRSRSEGDGSFYSKLTQSLGDVKEKVEKTFKAPGFQQDLYYILIGLSGFLLITTALNSVFGKREERANMEDHYFLNGKTAGAKLPTYEDCIKADRELVMDITEQENYTKKNLSLPTFVVLEPVAAANISEPACVHTSSKHGEEKEENVA